MSVWKEIRCDAVPEADDCLSKSNAGLKGFQSITELHKEARKHGWIIRAGEATCPRCARKHGGNS